uniref:Acetyl-coenzyme A synthetase n=1 Tax=Talaromyces marneffei PM1 TaxID=1077442 RepID=A0A093X998_TALMA
MVNIPYETHFDLINERETNFDELLRRGAFSPLLLRQVIGTFFLLLIPLVIRHRSASHSKILRYGFHAVITAVCAYTILEVRFLGPANGYGTGLITTWFYIWSTTILLANDVQRDFKRIVKEPSDEKNEVNEESGSTERVEGTSKLRRRTAEQTPGPNQKSPKVYRWQPFPQKLSDRLDWVSDLIFNFRGPNWNWRLRSLPPLPEPVLRDVGEDTASVKQTKKSSQTDYKSPSVKLRYVLRSFLRDYLALDLLKLLLMRDPYFWGYVDSPPSPPWPFDMLAWSPVLVRSYRIILSLASVLFALDIITSLNPLFFLGISYLFPNFAWSITHQSLGEAWLYPDAFGPAISVLDQGLVGAWNTWWHQLFRFGFSECSRFLTDLVLPTSGSQSKGYKSARRVLQIMLAFSLSGLIHAMGSYTTFSDSQPWNAFLFFVLQGVGALTQYFVEASIIPAIIPKTFGFPRWLIRTTNLILILLWFYYTGPLVVDDFARAGIWMFEPIPLSLLRGGLGLGTKGDHWWCWRGSWFELYSGNTWWQSGIRLI